MLTELQSFSRNARLFILSTSLSSVGTGIFYLVFNIYVVEGLSYSEYFLGALLSASSFAAALFCLPAGIIGDKIGRKRCLLVGNAATVLFMALLAIITSGPTLIAANASLGLVNTLAFVSFAPFMMENASQKERVHLFSVQSAVNTLGFMVGSIMGGKLPSFFGTGPESLRVTLLIAVVLFCMGVIPLIFLTEEKKEVLFSRRIVESTSLMKKFLFMQLLIGFGAGLIVPFFNIFFRMKMNASMEMIGVIFSAGNVAIGIATFLAASLASRWGKVRSVVVAELGSLPFLMLMAYSPHVQLAVIGYIARAALMNMGGPIVSAFMMENLKETERATVNGIIQGAWNGSWAVSNIVAGTLMSRNMYEVPFLLTCVLYGISSVLFYWFFAPLESRKKELM